MFWKLVLVERETWEHILALETDSSFERGKKRIHLLLLLPI